MKMIVDAGDFFAVMVAQGKDKYRGYLNCVRVERTADPDKVRLVATNGHFLFHCITSADLSDDWPEAVSVKVDKKLAGTRLTIDLAKGVAETFKGKVLAERVNEDDAMYPDWRRVVPQGQKPLIETQIYANAAYVLLVSEFLFLTKTTPTPVFYGDGPCDPMVAARGNRIAVLMPHRKGENDPQTLDVVL
jgi:hypothetical protein